MGQFRGDQANVVIFGDSNTWVFGPAFRDLIVARTGIAAEQVVIKFKSGSRPRQWLADASNSLWTRAKKPAPGPVIAEAISPETRLVIVGLGGNMAANKGARANAVALLEQIEAAAPRARIVWRGVPPSTRKKSGALAPEAVKLKRYVLNRSLKRELVSRGFRVLDTESLGETWGAQDRRVYIDLVNLHAGGPASSSQKTIGKAADLAYEQDILDHAPEPQLVGGERVVRGPWASFVAARDDAIPSHVPRAAARDLVAIVAPTGILDALELGAGPADAAQAEACPRHQVIDAKAIIRGGPPKFESTGRIIPVGTFVEVAAVEGKNARVYGEEGTDYGWTRSANLEPAPPPDPATTITTATATATATTPLHAVVIPRHEQPIVVEPDLYTVVDDRALLREGPPRFAKLQPEQLVPCGARVRVDRTQGKYAYIRNDAGDIGWTASSNLRLLYRNMGALQAARLDPSVKIPVPSRGAKAKAIARTYNRLGGLMRRLADELGIDVAAILAVWQAESGGRPQSPGRMTIRFENHAFFGRWGKRKPDLYQRHFRHNRERRKAHKDHACDIEGSGRFETFHGDQDKEYEVLSLAKKLAKRETALRCISMGGPQIMGFNYAKAGFASACEMYDAFQEGERNQVLGFFDFLVGYNPKLLRDLQARDWTGFGKRYNGSEAYGNKIRENVAVAEEVLAALERRPA